MCTAVQYKELTATRAGIVQKHSQSLGSLWGDHAWGQGRWKDPSALGARVWVWNWEGGGSSKDPRSWGCLRGGCTAGAGQNKQGRNPSAEFRTRHRGAQKALLGGICARWTPVLSPASSHHALSPGCSCSSSNGCDLCRLFSVLTEPQDSKLANEYLIN